MDKEDVILVDWKVKKEWEFKKGMDDVSERKWVIRSWDNAGIRQNKADKILCIAKYFRYALEIFLHRKRYGTIVSWQQFYGLIFAFYCKLFKVKKINKLVVMTFIYKAKQGVIGIIYEWFIKTIVQSGYIDKILVYSSAEVKYYATIFQVKEELFQFFPLAINSKKVTENTTFDIEKPFLLAAGRSNRDYKFLFECASAINMRIVIVCDSMNTMVKAPENVTVFNNVGGEDYFKVLNECYAVLIPLKEQNISSGQLVMLQAMLYEKPIIITESSAIADYVENDINAIICKKNVNDFVFNVNDLLHNSEKYRMLTKNGIRIFKEKFSLYSLGKRVGDCVGKL